MQANIFAVLLEHFSQVHAQRLENQAQVLLVIETIEQTQAMELVVRIGCVQFAQKLQLFYSTLVPIFKEKIKLKKKKNWKYEVKKKGNTLCDCCG